MSPESIRPTSSKPSNFLRREVRPVPSSANPPIGSHIAKKMPRDRGATDDVVAGVVLTVITEVPEAFGTALGLNEHVAGWLTTGVTLQVRFTVVLKPATGAIVIVDVADPPAVTEAGVSGDALTVKSGVPAPLTVRPTVVL